MTPTWFGPSWHHSHHCHHHYHWHFDRIHIYQPGFVTGQCKDPLEVSVLSVAGQLIRWEHTPTHFLVDFRSLHIVLYCIHLHYWTWKHLCKPKIGTVKTEFEFLNWSGSLQQQVRNNDYYLKSGQVGGGRQVGGSGARSSWQLSTSALAPPLAHILTCPTTIQLNRICCLWNVSTIFPTPST